MQTLAIYGSLTLALTVIAAVITLVLAYTPATDAIAPGVLGGLALLVPVVALRGRWHTGRYLAMHLGIGLTVLVYALMLSAIAVGLST